MNQEYNTNGGEGRGNPDTRHAAEQYLRAGVMVIPVPAGEKNPNRPGWQRERWAVEDVPSLWNNGQGIGALRGGPSGSRVDIDCDWREACAAAPYIAPRTRTFGRPGAPASHYVLHATGTLPKTKRYKVPGDGDDRSVVELLSTGTQSLVPPNLHHSGERRRWYDGRAAAKIEGAECEAIAADIATAALIARNWPGQGACHDYTLAATGYIGRRLPQERAERVMEAAIHVSGDEEAHGQMRDVRSTLDTLEAGKPATGGPTLNAIAPGVVDQLRRWHGWGAEQRTEHVGPDHGAPSFNLTDLGNAERLVARHGADLRYCHPWGKWLAWDGIRWVVDASGEVERRVIETVRGIYAEAEDATDSTKRRNIAQHAMRSESHSRIEAMMALARPMPGIPVAPDDLDNDTWLLNAQNGAVSLKSAELRPHRREDLITKLAPVEYNGAADAPTWRAALERWLPFEALRRFVQRLFGYALTGDVSEQVLPFLHGPGANGKTTMTNTALEIMGDYGQQAAPDLLLAKRGSHPTELADLFGARLVASVEVEDGRRLAESLVKQLTGGDRIKARRMREDFWEFAPTHKVFLAANHKPVVRGTDHAIWRRIKLVPFDVVIPKGEQDSRLPKKLRAELPGILAWAVHGCLEWQREGLGEPDEVRAATDQYRDESDALSGFIDECCVVRPDAWCKFKPLYAAYADKLTERGFAAGNGSGNVAIRRGIALRHDGDPGPSRVNDHGPKTEEPHDLPPEGGKTANPGVNELTVDNSQIACKSGSSVNGVNNSYPESGMNEADTYKSGYVERPLTDVNSLTLKDRKSTQHEGGGEIATPRGDDHRRLTADEAERVQRLIHEGMSPRYARAEILGEE